MIQHKRVLLVAFLLGTISAPITAQEVPGGDPDAPAPPPGVDKYYWDLSQSKDPKDRPVKSMAERYLNLVKVQEWSDLSGKFRTIARYVKHDPNMTTVTIESIKGRGADRTTKEVTVPVDKLSKICQSRVKQIDTVQKKIKEMAPPKPGENGALPGTAGEFPGGELASAPGSEGGPSAPMPLAAPEPDPSAAEPDPLGFAEVVLAPPVPPGGEAPPPEGEQPPAIDPNASPSPNTGAESSPATAPFGANALSSAATPADGPMKHWQTDFEAFRANFKVSEVTPGQAPSNGKTVRVQFGTVDNAAQEWDIDFGDLDELRAIAEVQGMILGRVTKPASRAELERKVKDAQDAEKRIGEVVWEADFRMFGNSGSPPIVELRFPPLPQPMSILCRLDNQNGAAPEPWKGLKRGDRVRFKGRLSMANDSAVALYVKDPEKIGTAATPVR